MGISKIYHDFSLVFILLVDIKVYLFILPTGNRNLQFKYLMLTVDYIIHVVNYMHFTSFCQCCSELCCSRQVTFVVMNVITFTMIMDCTAEASEKWEHY